MILSGVYGLYEAAVFDYFPMLLILRVMIPSCDRPHVSMLIIIRRSCLIVHSIRIKSRCAVGYRVKSLGETLVEKKMLVFCLLVSQDRLVRGDI